MISRLQHVVDTTNPKQLAIAIKKDQTLHKWVMTHFGNTLAEKVYNILYPDNHTCVNSKQKKFNSVTTGYKFCGRANVCKCTAELVSEKVKLAKATISDSEKEESNNKRSATNVKKYGVANAGQTEKAKLNHKTFYADMDNVKASVNKQQHTMLVRYDVKNAAHLSTVNEKKKHTLLERYGVENPSQYLAFSDKAQNTKKERYEPFHLAKLNYKRFIQNAEENFNVTPLVEHDAYEGIGTRPHLNFKCITCGNIFNKRFDYAAPPICKICNPTDILYKSKEELELYEFCKTLSNEVISGDRTQISPYEIDVYFPTLKVGIEYCGLYWHSEISGKKSWNYHYRKYQAAANVGIQLITLYSDEWLNSKDVVKELIRNKLGVSSLNIHARKCSLSRIKSDIAYEFYKQTHLQAPPKNLPINYGLTYKDKLCAVMSFVKRANNNYELTRFASTGRVMGGASKLLTAFTKEYHPNTISSFSNNRYSNGGLYKTLGFELVSTVPPMQEYVFKYSSRLHKLGINKFINETKGTKTEWEAARDIGCDRIWDCGKLKWEVKM